MLYNHTVEDCKKFNLIRKEIYRGTIKWIEERAGINHSLYPNRFGHKYKDFCGNPIDIDDMKWSWKIDVDKKYEIYKQKMTKMETKFDRIINRYFRMFGYLKK